MLEIELLKKRLIKDESGLWRLVDPDLAKQGFSVKEQCQVLGISRSGYYEKAKREAERHQ